MKDIEFSLEMLVKLHLIKLLTASPYRQHISRMSSISNGLQNLSVQQIWIIFLTYSFIDSVSCLIYDFFYYALNFKASFSFYSFYSSSSSSITLQSSIIFISFSHRILQRSSFNNCTFIKFLLILPSSYFLAKKYSGRLNYASFKNIISFSYIAIAVQSMTRMFSLFSTKSLVT